MYERSYGYRYAELGDHPTTAEIARAIRADVKQAVSEGLLPVRWSYSVRSDSLAVDVEVRDCLDAWQPCDGGRKCRNVWCAARNDPVYAHAAEAHMVLTDEAEAARMTLERIHGAYNHDGSEVQTDYFDVRYYGGVSFEDEGGRAFRLRERERLEARKAARDEAKPVGVYVNYSRAGDRTVHLAVETPDGKVVLACGARTWRTGLGGLSRAGTDGVDCSRCVKHAARLGVAAASREP